MSFFAGEVVYMLKSRIFVKCKNLQSVMRYSILLICALMISLAGCIKSEPLNAECDILGASLPADVLNGAPVIKNNAVDFHVKLGTDVSALAPEFELTPGAVIEPPSGTVRDFTTPQVYTVTSQDRQWSKDYIVSATDGYDDKLVYEYSFDNVAKKETKSYVYDIFYEVNDQGEKDWEWATANAGYAMSGPGTVENPAAPSRFPTYRAENGMGGYCAVLQTVSTGPFGVTVNKPIAAGNLFTGTFNTLSAITKPLLATHFGEGRPFYKYPLYFRGTYKYTAGPVYTVLDKTAPDKLTPVPDKQDECNIYAVLFRTDEKFRYLDGENVLAADNDYIIATAEILPEERRTTDGWRTFGVPFALRPGKSIDPEVLANGGYNMAIVASSSIEGDFFNGALGSTLMIDRLEIYCLDKIPTTEE